MPKLKEDLRVKRTKDTIINTFKQMLTEMDLSEITVKDLTERAGINRKTFYLHYSHIDELINSFLSDMLEKQLEYTKEAIRDKDPYAIIRDCLHFYALNAELYYKLFSRIDLHIVSNTYFEKAKIPFDTNEFVPGTKYYRIAGAFMSSAVQSIFCSWFADGQQISIDELADYAIELIFNGVDMRQ